MENRGLASASNWQALDADRGFQDLIGPIFRVSDLTPSSAEPIRLGFRVAAKHCNAAGVCHGGMLSAFLDCALGTAVFESTENRVFTPTLNLSIDFIQSALVDQWLESRVRLTHMTSGVGYCDGIIQGPQGPIARAHAVFRLPKKAHAPV